jgi:hypothetical protein
MIQYLPNQWTTFDNKKATMESADHQHLSNIYWYLRIFWGCKDNELWQVLTELQKRFEGKVLPYRPHPKFKEEHAYLHRNGMVDADGNIVFAGEIIGSVLPPPKENFQLEIGE